MDESRSISTFSCDVLRLEISDLKEDHLSVIDGIGIFNRTAFGVITKYDTKMVGVLFTATCRTPVSRC